MGKNSLVGVDVVGKHDRIYVNNVGIVVTWGSQDKGVVFAQVDFGS